MTPRPPRSTPFPYTTLFRSDVIDNAAYDDAKNAQARLEARILELEQMLATARTITHLPTQEISLGSVVQVRTDRKSTRLNSSHPSISYAVFCLKKKKTKVCM